MPHQRRPGDSGREDPPILLERVRIQGPAHGGHAVARHEGRVVFVRHTAPGELVDVAVTEAGARARFWRGDAVAVHEPSPHRVAHVWPEAGPGGVGGAELGHLSLAGQREWKAQVLRETLQRIGKIDPGPVPVVAPPGDDGLGRRTRVELVADGEGRPAMYRHRSHELVAVTQMPLGDERFAPLLARRWPAGSRLTLIAGTEGVTVLVDGEVVQGRTRVHEHVPVTFPDGTVREYDYQVLATGFWQVHRAAPALLASAVLAALEPRQGERLLELYSGAGLFTLPLADAVGPTGSVHAIEGAGDGARAARRNAAGRPWIRLTTAEVGAALASQPTTAIDAVVLDPPRSGAGAAVMTAITGLGARRLVYVACDPAALARDAALAAEHGYRLASLRAYDIFPHTHHIEAVAVLERT